MLYSLLIGLGMMVCFFSVVWYLSRALDNYSFVDIAWAYGLLFLLPLYFVMFQGAEFRKALIWGMAAAWSLRLGTHLLIRIVRHHPEEDVRYQVLRKKWAGEQLGWKFYVFFQAQGLLILVLSVPMALSMRNPVPTLLPLEVVGLFVCLIGIAGEALADFQMQNFKSDKPNKGRVCNAGLWRYSRHPNYFFEFVAWMGFWLFACGSPWGWITIYAPVAILYFLLRVTGIPLTEKCSVESKGQAYRDYQRTTSAFVPWPPKDKP